LDEINNRSYQNLRYTHKYGTWIYLSDAPVLFSDVDDAAGRALFELLDEPPFCFCSNAFSAFSFKAATPDKSRKYIVGVRVVVERYRRL
jgi:hypothetical protein